MSADEDRAYVAYMDEQIARDYAAHAEFAQARYLEAYGAWREMMLEDDPHAEVTEEDYNEYLAAGTEY